MIHRLAHLPDLDTVRVVALLHVLKRVLQYPKLGIDHFQMVLALFDDFTAAEGCFSSSSHLFKASLRLYEFAVVSGNLVV